MAFLDIVWKYKYLLAFYTVVISFGSFTALYLVGLVPSELKMADAPAYTMLAAPAEVLPVNNKASKTVIGQLPKRVIISKIGVDSYVSNPTSTDTSILNEALLSGAVRYPGSGTLGHGNMFLFGHSTGIRIVNNQAYKAFNHLNQMALGDTISVQSSDTEYTYSVTSVALIDSDEKLVDFSKNKDMLTLSTCDVFGEKQERYVVEAKFISSRKL